MCMHLLIGLHAIRILIALTSIYNLIVHQLDVKITFSNFEEEIYMDRFERFVVCKLLRSLCGLKQAFKQWHSNFESLSVSNSFHMNMSNEYVYSMKYDRWKVILYLYVDDI